MNLLAAAALAAISVASISGNLGSVNGTVKVYQAGYKLNCTRVWLIPRSPETDALISARFGTLDEGINEMSYLNNQIVRKDPPDGTRVSRCSGRFSEKFSFADVPPGDYYLTLTASPSVRYESETQPGPATVEMMRRVTVASKTKSQFDLRHIN